MESAFQVSLSYFLSFIYRENVLKIDASLALKFLIKNFVKPLYVMM